jgi:hypothetical protein
MMPMGSGRSSPSPNNSDLSAAPGLCAWWRLMAIASQPLFPGGISVDLRSGLYHGLAI